MTGAAPSTQQVPRGGNAGFRAELHGIRGVALTLVVVFHLLGNGRVSGGIDVFLTITGFLVTGSLLRQVVDGGGRLNLRSHYTRLAQRLLPPLLVVCAAVAIAALALLPSTRWLQVARELTASVLYYENWELIRSQLSYDAAGPASSPLQHIWSLSIQGQLHLLWPALVLAAAWWATRRRLSPSAALAVVLALVFAASFGYAINGMIQNPQVTYFQTGSRLWQPALGGLAAIFLPAVNLPYRVKIISGWLGLALIGTCGLFLDGAALFPGPAALWPTTGLILVLTAGFTGSRHGADRVLSSRWLHFVADISYSLYLWHWPLLVCYLLLARQQRLDLGGALIVLSVTVALAWLTWRLVETGGRSPARRANPRRALIAVASTAILAVTFGTSSAALGAHEGRAAQGLTDQDAEAQDRAPVEAKGPAEPEAEWAAEILDPDHPGAAAMALGTPIPAIVDREDVVPAIEAAALDAPEVYEWGCIQANREGAEFSRVLVCDDDSVAEPRARVVVSGGSFVINWWPALSIVAARNDWQLIVISKDACLLSADRVGSLTPPSEACNRWNELALDVIVAQEPDAVFTLGSYGRGNDERTPPEMTELWQALGDQGIEVLAVRNTPRLDKNVPDCLWRQGPRPIECGNSRSDLLSPTFPLVTPPGNVTFLDMTPYLCTDEVCPAIIGNVVAYRDSGHITATYMKTMAPYLEATMRAEAPWLFD